MIKKFEDLEVWQESMNLATEIYNILNSLNDNVLKQQIQKTVVSVPSNIAEGFDRQSNREFIQYLYISKGSCSVLRTQLYLLRDLGLVDINQVNSYIENTRKISAM